MSEEVKETKTTKKAPAKKAVKKTTKKSETKTPVKKTTTKKAPAKAPAKKTVKKAETKSKELSISLEDGSIIDLDSYEWGKIRTRAQKLFIFWYTYPGTPAYHSAAKAARKAGYAEKTAHKKSYSFLKEPEIARVIKEFDNLYIKTTIHDAYLRLMSRKLIRAEFDTSDFYKFVEVVDKEGNQYTRLTIKDFDELSYEQKLCIDGVEYSGQRSIPNYKLPNRKQEEEEIIRLYEMHNDMRDKDEFNVETTAEIIKDKLSIQTKIINTNQRLAEKAKNFRKANDDLPEED